MRLILSVATLVLCFHLTAQQFSDVTNEAGVFHLPIHQSLMGGGVVWLDYDSDGNEDIYFSGCRVRDVLYRNNGDGTFSNATFIAGLTFTDLFNTMGAVQGDLNNDGFPELFITTWENSTGLELVRNILYLNNGDGTFTDISAEAGLMDESWSTSTVMLDVNLDGFLDIYVLNYMEETGFILDDDGVTVGFDHDCYDNYLYLNNGNLTFTESAESYGLLSGGCGLALSASDVDKDGDPDLQIANDFGEFITPNQLFINNFPDPTFTDVSMESGFDLGMYGMGIAVGDIDNDLDQDFYITNMGKNELLTYELGADTFTNITNESGTANSGNGELLYTSWGDMFMDVDNDGFMDLFSANGHMSAAAFIQNVQDDPDKLFMNNGDLTFTDNSEESGVDYRGISRGAAYADYNSDGFLDIAVSGIQNPFFSELQGVQLYTNLHTSGNWIALTLEGVVSNRSAFGSKVTLYSGGNSFYRELLGGSSHLSQNQSLIHFGLGEIQEIDSLVISWPNGLYQTVIQPELNTRHHFIEDYSSGILEKTETNLFLAYPSPLMTGQDLTLKLPEESGILEVYEMDGKLVYSCILQNKVDRVNLGLSSGIYLIKLKTKKHQWVEKIHITE